MSRMMIARSLLFGLAGLVLAGCRASTALPAVEPPITSPTAKVGLANPAAVYCVEQGGQSEILTAADGSQSGLCLFPDGSVCEEWAYFRGGCQPGVESALPTPEIALPFRETSDPSPTAQAVSAWAGSIHSLPAADPYDDYVEWMPPGSGAVGLQGATPELQAAIANLRDAGGMEQTVHLWGRLQCGVDDYGGCRLLVSDLRYGVFQTQESVDGWTGTVTCSHFNSGPDYSCGNSFTLTGPFPLQFGLWSPEPKLLAELEKLRDSGAPIRVWGVLLAGVPDINGVQLQVSRLELRPTE